MITYLAIGVGLITSYVILVGVDNWDENKPLHILALFALTLCGVGLGTQFERDMTNENLTDGSVYLDTTYTINNQDTTFYVEVKRVKIP